MTHRVTLVTTIDRYKQPGLFPSIHGEIRPVQGDYVYVDEDVQQAFASKGYPIRLQVKQCSYHAVKSLVGSARTTELRVELHYSDADLQSMNQRGIAPFG